jgi:hypothetical protein
MFQLYPGALDAELDRRHELALTTMQAVHGVATVRERIPDLAPIRHVVVMLTIALIASVR